jgi:hypothetical protein
MVVLGFAPFGSLLVGHTATWKGAPFTLSMCACFCLMGSLVYLLSLYKSSRQKPVPSAPTMIQTDAEIANKPGGYDETEQSHTRSC